MSWYRRSAPKIAAPLTAALERINTLTSTGRIDRKGLRDLRLEVESARQAGMIGQQLTRFASGRLRQSHERLQLAEVVNGVLAHRGRETQARGIVLKPSLKSVEVIVDASLLFSLLNSMLDWSLANAHSQVDLAIDTKQWPAHARLHCRFANRPHDGLDAAVTAHGLDSLSWRLLEQTAWTMGLVVERNDNDGITALVLEFPRTVSNEIEGVSALEINDGFAPSSNSQPLAGSHVLVVASRREMRVQIRDALRNMSLIVDFVNSVDEAVSFCRDGLPHAVIIESIQSGGAIRGLPRRHHRRSARLRLHRDHRRRFDLRDVGLRRRQHGAGRARRDRQFAALGADLRTLEDFVAPAATSAIRRPSSGSRSRYPTGSWRIFRSSSPINQVQAVERLAGHVLLDVRVVLAEQAHAGRLAGHRVVLVGQLHLLGRLGHDRQERHAQRLARLGGEKLGHRVVAAGDDPARILHAHRLDGVHEQRLALRHGRFGGPVHRRHELVDALLLAGELQQLRRVVQKTGQRNANFRVVEESTTASEQPDCRRRAALERCPNAERRIPLR